MPRYPEPAHPIRPRWSGPPPDPARAPDLYRDVVLRRTIAFLVDIGVLSIAALALWVASFVLTVLSLGVLGFVGAIVLAVLPFAYHILFIAYRGATPGMSLLDLAVRTWSGESPEILHAVIRTVVFYASMSMTGGLILLVALFNDRRRLLHDMLSGTVAVRARSPA